MKQELKLDVVSAIGGGRKTYTELDATMTVADLMRVVTVEKKLPMGAVIFMHNGQQLDVEATLSEVGLMDGDKIFMVTRTEGGIN